MADLIEPIPSAVDPYRDDLGARGVGKLDGRQMVVVDGRRLKPDTVAAATKAREVNRGDRLGSGGPDVVQTVSLADPDAPSSTPSPAPPAPTGDPTSIDGINALEYDDLKARVEARGLVTENRKKATLRAALAVSLGLG